MNIIVIIKFTRSPFEVSSVAATMLPGVWCGLLYIQCKYVMYIDMSISVF